MHSSSFVDDQFGLTSIQTEGMDMGIVWEQIEITKAELETNALGETTVKVHVNFSFEQTPVTNAVVGVEGTVCTEIEPGVYICKLSNWSPVQSAKINAEFADFEIATKTVTSIHVMNAVLYVLIVVLIVIGVVAFFLHKQKN